MDNKPTRQELDAAIDEYALAYADAEADRLSGKLTFMEAMKPVNRALAQVNRLLDLFGIKDE